LSFTHHFLLRAWRHVTHATSQATLEPIVARPSEKSGAKIKTAWSWRSADEDRAGKNQAAEKNVAAKMSSAKVVVTTSAAARAPRASQLFS